MAHGRIDECVWGKKNKNQQNNGYGHGYGYGGSSMYVPQETTTRVVDVYLFETVIYNLDLPDNEELVGVVSVKLTDPESYSKVAAKYTKAVAAEFTDEVKTKD